MGFGTQKILTNVGLVNFGAPESLYGSETAVTITSAGNWTVPSGYAFVTGDGTAAQLQYSPNSSTTWRQVAATGYCGDCFSDGFAWRVHNNATTAITIWYFSLA